MIRSTLLTCSFLLTASALASIEFHVTPLGKDANPGTASKPFATLARVQEAVRNAVERISPAVVGLRMSNKSSGSGVIVSEEGLIMTAAHVTHPPGKEVQIAVQFPDGRRCKAETGSKDFMLGLGLVPCLDLALK